MPVTKMKELPLTFHQPILPHENESIRLPPRPKNQPLSLIHCLKCSIQRAGQVKSVTCASATSLHVGRLDERVIRHYFKTSRSRRHRFPDTTLLPPKSRGNSRHHR